MHLRVEGESIGFKGRLQLFLHDRIHVCFGPPTRPNEIHQGVRILFKGSVDGGDTNRDATATDHKENLGKTAKVRYMSIWPFVQERCRCGTTVRVQRPAQSSREPTPWSDQEIISGLTHGNFGDLTSSFASCGLLSGAAFGCGMERVGAVLS